MALAGGEGEEELGVKEGFGGSEVGGAGGGEEAGGEGFERGNVAGSVDTIASSTPQYGFELVYGAYVFGGQAEQADEGAFGRRAGDGHGGFPFGARARVVLLVQQETDGREPPSRPLRKKALRSSRGCG
jgi:hypothetical protein